MRAVALEALPSAEERFILAVAPAALKVRLMTLSWARYSLSAARHCFMVLITGVLARIVVVVEGTVVVVVAARANVGAPTASVTAIATEASVRFARPFMTNLSKE